MSGDYKQKLKQRLPITRLLEFYGARHVSSDLYHCHPNLGHASEDKHPSLIANDARGVAKCLGNCALNQGSSDIFEVIKRAEKCNFNDALKRAGEIANLPEFGQESARPSQRPFKKKKGLDNKDLNRVPKVYALEERHQAWLEQRFSAEWRWLADYFNIKAWHYHIAVPIDRSEVNWVFIPLDKQKDQTFYRGPSRS
ncbi:MAG: hypothetical protein GWO38_03890, partial [Phycisphaerae bacterium]|nr:hypothetical protein [Phycisphaerae bacterium]NIX26783.1 hypothetical protein [Phycisphaerae bacterium]